jgi:hypothetical protein
MTVATQMADKRPVVILDPDKLVIDRTGVQGLQWPLPPAEVEAMRDNLISDMTQMVRNADDETADDRLALRLSLIFFVPEIVYAYQLTALNNRSEIIGEIKKTAVPGKSYSAIRRLYSPAAQPPAWRTPFRRLRAFFKQEAVRMPPLSHISMEKDIVAVNIGGGLDMLAALVPERVVYCPLWYWYRDIDWNAGSPVSTRLQDKVMASIECAFRQGGEVPENEIRQSFRDLLNDLTRHFKEMLAHLRRHPDRMPRHLWLTSAGNPHARVLAQVVREQGGTVTGFDHGTSSGTVDLPIQSLIEFDNVDRFYTFTEDMAKGLAENAQQEWQLSDKLCNFLPMPVSKQSSPITTHQPTAARQDVPLNVMYVSTRYNGAHLHWMPLLLPDPLMIDWQARLFANLQQMNVTIHHKPHPSNPFPTPAAFKNISDIKTHSEPFEISVKHADLLIFDYPMSTAFRNAIVTDIPVILIDFGIVKFKPAARKLLEKRCSIVSTNRGENGSIQINWSDLEIALAEAGRLRDQSFATAYYKHLI